MAFKFNKTKIPFFRAYLSYRAYKFKQGIIFSSHDITRMRYLINNYEMKIYDAISLVAHIQDWEDAPYIIRMVDINERKNIFPYGMYLEPFSLIPDKYAEFRTSYIGGSTYRLRPTMGRFFRKDISKNYISLEELVVQFDTRCTLKPMSNKLLEEMMRGCD